MSGRSFLLISITPKDPLLITQSIIIEPIKPMMRQVMIIIVTLIAIIIMIIIMMLIMITINFLDRRRPFDCAFNPRSDTNN